MQGLQQIAIIKPKVIITLGRYSMGLYLPHAKISDVHGQAMRIKGRLVVPMYHPAAALHQGSLKPVVESDFLRLPDLLAKTASVPEENTPPTMTSSDQNATQLSLF